MISGLSMYPCTTMRGGQGVNCESKGKWNMQGIKFIMVEVIGDVDS
jgi:hypothetical protein